MQTTLLLRKNLSEAVAALRSLTCMHSDSSLARSSEGGEARDVCPLQGSSGGKVEQRERERGRERGSSQQQERRKKKKRRNNK